MIPKLRFPEFTHDWFEASLQDEYDYKNAKAHEPYVVENGRYKLINSKFISTEGKKFKTVDSVLTKGSEGDVTMVLSDLPNGKALAKAFYVEEDDTYAINQRICRLRVLNKQKNDSKFFYYLINRNSYFLRLDDGITQTHISKGDVLNFRYNTTQLNEQTRIRDLFNCVDQKLNLLTKKKEALEAYKKGLMQKIFSQELRFKREDGTDYPEWEYVILEQVITEVKIKSEYNNQYPVLTSSRRGLFFQSDYYSKQVASEDNTGYNVVPRGCFTYRHMSDDLVFKFNINYLCDFGLVSTLYPVFKVIPDKVSAEFLLLKLNEGQEFKQYCLMLKQGGSRTYMYLNKLKKLNLVLPSIEEQRHIMKVVKALERKIECCNESLLSTEKLKKGLLQQMFI